MTMKLFLDTNILIDKLANRDPFVEDVRKLCIARYFGDVELLVSAQSYLDAMYVLRKFAAKEAIKKACIKSLNFFEVSDVPEQAIRQACESDWPDAEDHVIAITAKLVMADFLVTRDPGGFRQSPVQPVSPASCISMLRDEYGIEYAIA